MNMSGLIQKFSFQSCYQNIADWRNYSSVDSNSCC